ncbi:G-type lectin S-receptor-like serine/threonine-protein kinase At4g27290 [Argentina anserina]|uniref:G-type lectin S-receptor-like serine/threonine-protein kinase At4g27290 n=1 Tax=Argentina anserina TaxID=57926 RepID=UPI0021764D31|nr:G-type lectin S-receptor-like serine/threonine-protein kinase At4g27290 [Potentilla anserina]
MESKTTPRFLVSLLFISICLKSHLCCGADTITANQSLSGDHTIVSAGGKFELGFFKPGNSSNYYIGMWYYKTLVSLQTIVWVANREQPVSDRFSSELRISDGNLVLFNESKLPIWSTEVSSTSGSSVHVVLLDNGNLVLRAGSDSSLPLWQSFDYPADTFLPEARIGFNIVTNRTRVLTSWKNAEDPAPGLYSLELDPNGTDAYYILWNRSRQYRSSGAWDPKSRLFTLVPEMRLNYIYNFSYVKNKNESYFTYSLYDPKIVSRFIMDVSGQIKQLSWLPSQQWNLFWSQPSGVCEAYAYCGAFASCNELALPSCTCLDGFEPKIPRYWTTGDFSGGCSRRSSLQCDNAVRVKFVELLSNQSNVDKPYHEINSTEACESICSDDCECTAYAYSQKAGCSTWTREISENRNGTTLHIKTYTFQNANSRTLVIALVSATAGLLTVTSGYFLWKKRTRKERKYGETISKDDVENDTELPLFGLRSILSATNNFSEANRLGEGGFGPVYKGILVDNQEVAIKRLSKNSGQGYKEFMNELKLIAKLQHTNLVKLLGCCSEDEERILIYEYMPNQSLDKSLFDSPKNTMLDWGKRFQIINGIAQGVLYIHKFSRLKIIHRDLKASNILLDGEMNPKISDFGMAKIIEINKKEANTNRVVGTYGYMSPEYALYGHVSEKLDIFSFGVLLLEIVSGKRNAAFVHFEQSPTLAGWAWNLWKEGREMEVISASVRKTCQPQEALRCIQIGFLCVQEDPADRPTMSSVIRMLQGNPTTSLPLSKEPAFSTHCGSHTILSNNSVTISIPEGR